MSDALAEIVGRLMDDNARLLARIGTLEGRMDTQFRSGKVTKVDNKHKDGPRFKMELGERDGTVVESPWLPQRQFAGDFKSYTPLVKDQPVSLFCPNGEPRQGYVMPGTWSDKFKAPSDKDDEHVDTFGEKYRKRWKKDEFVERTMGKSRLTQKADGTFRVSAADENEPKDKNGQKADDDQHNEDGGKGVLLQLGKDHFEIKYQSTHFRIEGGKIFMKVEGNEVEVTSAGVTAGGTKLITFGPNFLGQDSKTGQEGQFVETQGGPSTTVKAKV